MDKSYNVKVMAVAETVTNGTRRVGCAFWVGNPASCYIGEWIDCPFYQKLHCRIQGWEPAVFVIGNSKLACSSRLESLLKGLPPIVKGGGGIEIISEKFFDQREGLQVLERSCYKESLTSMLVATKHRELCLRALAALFAKLKIKGVFSEEAKTRVEFMFCGASKTLLMDHYTVANLELVQSANLGSSESDTKTFYKALNFCKTPMGMQQLRESILQPLFSKHAISTRWDFVEELTKNKLMLESVQASLASCPSVYPLIKSVLTSLEDSPKDLKIGLHSEQLLQCAYSIAAVCRSVANLNRHLTFAQSALARELRTNLKSDFAANVLTLLEDVFDDDGQPEGSEGVPVTKSRHRLSIKTGLNPMLDVARRTYNEVLDDITGVAESIQNQLDVTIKVHYSHSEKYYLTVKDGSRASQVSTESQLVDSGIFINICRKGNLYKLMTLDLLKLNQRLKQSESEVYSLSSAIIKEFFAQIREELDCIYLMAETLGMIDMLASFAQYSIKFQCCRPTFSSTIALTESRHPMLVASLYPKAPVPNNIYLGADAHFQLITGANMTGKSTYLRQTAFLCILAQIGCFVPAKKASFKVLKTLFCHIGQPDSLDLKLGASSFTIEMRQLSYIIQNADSRSLVILDEFARSTAISDAIGVAYAASEALVDKGVPTLFATHFHQLVGVLRQLPAVVCLHPSAELTQSRIVPHFEMSDGPAQLESYGIIAAMSVRFPVEATEYALKVKLELQSQLEKHKKKMVSVVKKLDGQRRVLEYYENLVNIVNSQTLTSAEKEGQLRPLYDELLSSQALIVAEEVADFDECTL